MASKVEEALDKISILHRDGYSAIDILTTLFRVIKTYPTNEFEKLEFIRYIGYAHMKCLEGVDSKLQLSALCCKLSSLGVDIKENPFEI